LYFNDTVIPASKGGKSKSIVARNAGQYKVNVTSTYGCAATSDPYNYSVLPLQLISFKATLVNIDVLLKWATAQGQNTNYFNIERSIDAINFKTVGRVKAAGNSNLQVDYIYTDSDVVKLNSNIAYYRLKMVDKDGKYTYSMVQALRINDKEIISVIPNPFTTSF
jgi:hypothetical protein